MSFLDKSVDSNRVQQRSAVSMRKDKKTQLSIFTSSVSLKARWTFEISSLLWESSWSSSSIEFVVERVTLETKTFPAIVRSKIFYLHCPNWLFVFELKISTECLANSNWPFDEELLCSELVRFVVTSFLKIENSSVVSISFSHRSLTHVMFEQITLPSDSTSCRKKTVQRRNLLKFNSNKPSTDIPTWIQRWNRQ